LIHRISRLRTGCGPTADVAVLALGRSLGQKPTQGANMSNKTHLLNSYAKLGVNDRAAAVAEGYIRGLLHPPGAD
jgi:hypothetical protein